MRSNNKANRVSRITTALLLLAWSAVAGGPAGPESVVYVESRAHLVRFSRGIYNDILAGKFPVNGTALVRYADSDTEALLHRIAGKLSLAAGNGAWGHPIALVKPQSGSALLNAMCLPGGEILFGDGMLSAIEKRAREIAADAKNPLNKGGDYEKHREGMIAGVMGHEIGHYLGRHTLRNIMRHAKSPGGPDLGAHLKDLRYGREHELESDSFSLRTMSRAGYRTRYVVEVLKMLKELSDQNPSNPYTSSHPSGHERLAGVKTRSQGKDYHKRMADLEFAFGAVETGTDLARAALILKRELAAEPSNPHLLSAMAKVMHRRWEESCSVEQILFKASIVQSPFRDALLLKSRATRGAGVPGNAFFYRAAVSYYEDARRNGADLLTVSAYATLLAIDPKRQKDALQIATALDRAMLASGVTSGGHAFLANNLGIVYFWNGQPQQAAAKFASSGRFSNEVISLAVQGKAAGVLAFLREQKLLQTASSRNIGLLFEAHFNLAQLLWLSNEKPAATAIWRQYLTNFDQDSVWARYAAASIDFNLASVKPLPYPAVDGVQPGAAVSLVVQRWGAPDLKQAVEGNSERWDYVSKHATVFLQGGTVIAVALAGPKSPALPNGLRVGMSRTDVLGRLGPPDAEDSGQARYPKAHLVLVFGEEQLSQIWVVK